MSNSTAKVRRAALAVLAVMLPLSAVACGSDDDVASDSSAQETDATASNDDGTGADGSASDDSAPDDGEAGGAGQDEPADGVDGDVGAPVWNCEADSNNLSGSSTVLFAGDVDSGATEADITDETTAVISADGSGMEPSALTVEANTMFGIEMEDGGPIDGVIIGCAGGQTITSGMTIGFLITELGTYPVSLEIGGSDVGTIVVE